MKQLRETVVCVLCVFPLTAVEADPDEKQLCVFPLTAVEADPDEKQLHKTVVCDLIDSGISSGRCA